MIRQPWLATRYSSHSTRWYIGTVMPARNESVSTPGSAHNLMHSSRNPVVLNAQLFITINTERPVQHSPYAAFPL
jgi:hypothetical protein